jgi:hypothetical protein
MTGLRIGKAGRRTLLATMFGGNASIADVFAFSGSTISGPKEAIRERHRVV